MMTNKILLEKIQRFSDTFKHFYVRFVSKPDFKESFFIKWYFWDWYSFRLEIERMFDSKDKDLDGRLSFEEFMGEQSRAERLFKLMDKDGDGFVTKNVSFSWPKTKTTITSKVLFQYFQQTRFYLMLPFQCLMETDLYKLLKTQRLSNDHICYFLYQVDCVSWLWWQCI